MDQVLGNSIIFYFSILNLLKKRKIHIETIKANLREKSSFSDHSKRGFLIRKLSISFSKNLARTDQNIQSDLENRIKTRNKT